MRVSTERQGATGLGVDAQRSAIRRYVDLCQGKVLSELVEVESGKRADRPVLEQAITLCKRSDATMLVAKLDRLSRSVSFMSRLIDTGVDFVAVDNPHANKLMMHVISAFAEHERDLIAERTRAALASAKLRGVKLGNPKIADARVEAGIMIKANADLFCQNVAPIIIQIRSSGINSLQGVADALEAIPVRRSIEVGLDL